MRLESLFVLNYYSFYDYHNKESSHITTNCTDIYIPLILWYIVGYRSLMGICLAHRNPIWRVVEWELKLEENRLPKSAPYIYIYIYISLNCLDYIQMLRTAMIMFLECSDDGILIIHSGCNPIIFPARTRFQNGLKNHIG